VIEDRLVSQPAEGLAAKLKLRAIKPTGGSNDADAVPGAQSRWPYPAG
jgi:hypothetical protein